MEVYREGFPKKFAYGFLAVLGVIGFIAVVGMSGGTASVNAVSD
jgi:hypothetical protein